MPAHSFATKIKSIKMCKFAALMSGIPVIPDKNTCLDILPQVSEITIYESIFNPILKCDLALIDYIGLFVNFPLTGEEIIEIKYENVGDGIEKTVLLVIDSIAHINFDSNNRGVGFVIKCVSIEGLSNSLATVQQAYEGTTIEIAKQIFEQHITERTRRFFPSYRGPNLFAEDNESLQHTIVVPNVPPIAAIDMVQSLSVSEVSNKHTYMFYQTVDGFNFRTIQGLTQGTAARRYATNNKYIYLSNEIDDKPSKLNNEERIVSKIVTNRRHSSMQKVSTGYFNNVLFEINIAQKAYWAERTNTDDVDFIYDHHLNTTGYEQFARSFSENEEQSNRTKYVVSTQREHDRQFSLARSRQRWGKDLISKIALAQIDYTAVIPGTNRFTAGDLFYLDIPEAHGFNELKADDLTSGLFLITDVKHVIAVGGYHSTVLRLNKDSVRTTIDRDSRYA